MRVSCSWCCFNVYHHFSITLLLAGEGLEHFSHFYFYRHRNAAALLSVSGVHHAGYGCFLVCVCECVCVRVLHKDPRNRSVHRGYPFITRAFPSRLYISNFFLFYYWLTPASAPIIIYSPCIFFIHRPSLTGRVHESHRAGDRSLRDFHFSKCSLLLRVARRFITHSAGSWFRFFARICSYTFLTFLVIQPWFFQS